jgi:hypothetical protein
VLLIFPILSGCSGEPDHARTTGGPQPERTASSAEPGGSATEAPAWTRDPLRTTPSPGIREPEPSYGYTHGEPSGNRVAEGEGRLPQTRPVDVELGGEPVWVVGVPLGRGTGWVVALNSGRLEAFRLPGEGAEVEPWLVVPDELPPGAPPLVVAEDERLRLVSSAGGDPSPLTHPVPVGGRLLGVDAGGGLLVEPGGDIGVDALPDARVVRGEGGTLAVASDPTASYDHGVLGDEVEAGSITLLRGGAEGLEVSGRILPGSGGVFETLAPIWFEDPAGRELLAVTESEGAVGSRISAYAPDGTLALASPPVGEPMTWRHLLAAGPFGPNGEIELAVTRTPHVGGVVEFYRPNLDEGTLEIVAALPGYTTHTLYSRNLDTARAGDLDGDGAWEVLVPDRFRTGLAAIRHTQEGAEEAWKLPVGATLATNIASATDGEGRLSVAVGRADGVLRIWP